MKLKAGLLLGLGALSAYLLQRTKSMNLVKGPSRSEDETGNNASYLNADRDSSDLAQKKTDVKGAATVAREF